MPQITNETPRATFTIAGIAFQLAEPYVEGHVLTEGEADSMNQTFRENVRNNLASEIEEAKELAKTNGAEVDVSILQKTVDDYANGYEFGVRKGGGGRISDPIEAAALDLARSIVRDSIRANPAYKITNFKASDITEYAQQVLKENPQLREHAAAQVAAQREAASKVMANITLPARP